MFDLAISTSNPTAKKLKIVKDPFIQVVEYPTPTMELPKGNEIDTKGNEENNLPSFTDQN